MALPRSKEARAKRDKLRESHIDRTKKYSRAGDAFNKAKKLFGSSATVYVINYKYYPGKKSTDSYLKTLLASDYR